MSSAPIIKRKRPIVATAITGIPAIPTIAAIPSTRKFPTKIINALLLFDNCYESELEHFIEYVSSYAYLRPLNEQVKIVQDALLEHNFYSFQVARFLEDREMEDITEEKFNDFIYITCCDLAKIIFQEKE